MTSERQHRANRENAKRSSGPKSAQGKARSRGNARRHGLSGPRDIDGDTPELIKRIADTICGENCDPLAYQLALVVADAQVSLARVRSVRIATIKEARHRRTPSNPIEQTQQAIKDMTGALKVGDFTRLKRGTARLDAANKAHAKWVKAGGLEALVKGGATPPKDILPRDDLASVDLAFSELLALERYETRALSRRRRAIRILDALLPKMTNKA